MPLLDPQNLVFLAPFAVGLLLALLTIATGAMHGGHGHTGHGQLGHGGGHAHATSGGHPHGAPAPATGHAVPAHHSGGHHSAAHQVQNGAARGNGSAAARNVSLGSVLAAVTGVNQAPLTVLLWAFLIGWGFCGFWSQYLFHVAFGMAMPIAGIGGFLVARGSAALVSRMMPPDTTSAVMRQQLLGRTGHVAFPVSETAGRVHVYDEFGTLHAESCRLEKGQSPIAKGCEVLLIDYDDQRRLFLVERMSAAPVTSATSTRSMQ